MLCLRTPATSDCMLNTLFESSSGLTKVFPLGLACFDFFAPGGVDFWLAGGEGLSELSWWRAYDLVISPATLIVELGSFSCGPRVSHGRAAMYRSNQLQPHWGLVGSMNRRFADVEGFFHVCCSVKDLGKLTWMIKLYEGSYIIICLKNYAFESRVNSRCAQTLLYRLGKL